MGTRNLTAVYYAGEYRVAQYGQWDGYPSGQGLTCLEFLRDKMKLDVFKQALLNASWITDEEYEARWKECGADNSGWVTLEQSDMMKEKYPEMSRDTGAEILELIQNHPDGMKLLNNIEFAADGLFCEWAWVVDLDKGTFEGYAGFGHNPLTEDDRFYFLRDKEEGGYSGVRIVASFPLDNLPSNEEFLAAF